MCLPAVEGRPGDRREGGLTSMVDHVIAQGGRQAGVQQPGA